MGGRQGGVCKGWEVRRRGKVVIRWHVRRWKPRACACRAQEQPAFQPEPREWDGMAQAASRVLQRGASSVSPSRWRCPLSICTPPGPSSVQLHVFWIRGHIASVQALPTFHPETKLVSAEHLVVAVAIFYSSIMVSTALWPLAAGLGLS